MKGELIASSKEERGASWRAVATCWADGSFWWRSCSRPLCCGLQTQRRTPRGQGTARAQSQSGTWGEDTRVVTMQKEESHVCQLRVTSVLSAGRPADSKSRDCTFHPSQGGLLSDKKVISNEGVSLYRAGGNPTHSFTVSLNRMITLWHKRLPAHPSSSSPTSLMNRVVDWTSLDFTGCSEA